MKAGTSTLAQLKRIYKREAVLLEESSADTRFWTHSQIKWVITDRWSETGLLLLHICSGSAGVKYSRGELQERELCADVWQQYLIQNGVRDLKLKNFKKKKKGKKTHFILTEQRSEGGGG